VEWSYNDTGRYLLIAATERGRERERESVRIGWSKIGCDVSIEWILNYYYYYYYYYFHHHHHHTVKEIKGNTS